GELGQDLLEGDLAAQLTVLGAGDDAHAAAAELVAGREAPWGGRQGGEDRVATCHGRAGRLGPDAGIDALALFGGHGAELKQPLPKPARAVLLPALHRLEEVVAGHDAQLQRVQGEEQVVFRRGGKHGAASGWVGAAGWGP